MYVCVYLGVVSYKTFPLKSVSGVMTFAFHYNILSLPSIINS